MKVAILGDSHGQRCNIDIAMKQIEGKVDVVIHTGDIYADIEYMRNTYNIKIIGVKGNCDFHEDAADKLLEVIDGKRFFVTHGHKYNVKNNLNNIFYKGKEVNADIIVFGHSHIPYYSKEENVVLLNPGSISLPRGGSKKGYGVVTIQKDVVDVEQVIME
ncbi:MAG: metallophosphoesterase [Clostridiaceae bacterium]|nr:metallophosphoesterase [Clostridiaceae bacterium]